MINILYNNLVPSVCLYVCFRFKMADRAVVFTPRLVCINILGRSSVVAAVVNVEKVNSLMDIIECLGNIVCAPQED